MAQAMLLVYVAAAVALGIRTRARTLESFIVGDKLSTRAMVATVVSTFYGASAILGGVSLAYQVGLGVLWFMVPFYLGHVAVILLLKRIANSPNYTLPDYLGSLYGRRFAVASALLLATLCLIPEEIIAGAKVLTLFTPLSTELAMGIITLVLVVPVVIGGMRADVQTDIVQFLLMLLMLGVLAPFLLRPGAQALAQAPAELIDPAAILSPQEIAVLCVLLFFLPLTSAPLYQRFFAAESKASSQKAIMYAIILWVGIDVFVVLGGFAALQAFPNLQDPDMALIRLGEGLPLLGSVLFFVGLLAAIMSTVNSFLQSGASSLAYDLVRHVRPQSGEKRLLFFSRAFVVLLGGVSLLLALWFQHIVPALLFTLTMWIAGMLVPTLAALVGRPLSPRAALYSLVGGGTSTLAWHVWQPWQVDALFVGLGVSLLVALGTSLADRRSDI